MSLPNKHPSEFIRERIWNTGISDDVFFGDAATMLSKPEQKMLHWLAHRYFTGAGAIVDAGCYLGGSTLGFATGLARRENSNTALKRLPVIYSYDIFLSSEHDPNPQLENLGIFPGDSFYNLFLKKTEPYGKYIQSFQGDICQQIWNKQPIEILFIDVAKSWNVNQHLASEFFPALTPGASIVVQQDFNHEWAPWIAVAMEYYSEYFTTLCNEGPSKIFLLQKAIPKKVLQVNLKKELTADEKIQLMDSSINNSPDSSVYILQAAKAVLLFMEIGADQGVQHATVCKAKYGHRPWSDKRNLFKRYSNDRRLERWQLI